MERHSNLLERRKTVLRSCRLSFDDPFHPVRGQGYWLFDSEGRRYLDAYNNVPQVGHCHPRVISALCEQAARLNTNTRYLDELVVTYAERIVESMPVGLDAVIFTCTASEANDLAWRIASACTGNAGVITTENGYHGNTAFLARIDGSSPRVEALDWWQRLPAPPDETDSNGDDGSGYAQEMGLAVAELARRGLRPAAFFMDSYFCSDGVRLTRAGFLSPAIGLLREAGGLLVVDEVQAGLGRCGSSMWAFQRLGLRPDIVVLGKSLGNGIPIGAVVARSELIDAFYDAQRYFNTCAGNPVSSAVGCAVLDVMRDEGLVENARAVGRVLKRGLDELADTHASIKGVRGDGLLLGVELAQPGQTARHAGRFASTVVNELLRAGVVTGLTGPDRTARNILKIRPPLVFDHEASARLLDALDKILQRTH